MTSMYSRSPPPRPAPRGAGTPSHPASGRSRLDNADAAYAMLHQVLQRLEEVVQQETEALQSRRVADLQDFNTRKSHCLLELTRALRLIEGTPLDKVLAARLTGLRAMLEVNRAVLKTHLDAAQEVSTIIADALREAESDGTYSLSTPGAGRTL